jgi:beta-glucosidase
VVRPEKELKGFAKIELAPGESRELVFALDARAFAFYDVLRHAWTVEPGAFEILAGSSSADIRARATIELGGSIPNHVSRAAGRHH